MPTYLSPGVYVEEVPPLARPIAGVGTSTAGFIGVIPDSHIIPNPVTEVAIGVGDGTKDFKLPDYPVDTTSGKFKIRVKGKEVTGATLANDDAKKESTVTLTTAPAPGEKIDGDYIINRKVVAAGEVKLCTSFDEFKKFFGDFSTDAGQSKLAHAVYGFFNNGGSRCYVVRTAAETNITVDFLARTFEPIDEIAIVAAPGITNKTVRADIVTHCQIKTQDRVAIFDCAEIIEDESKNLDLTKLAPDSTGDFLPPKSNFVAFYFPWIQVSDPATKSQNPQGDGLIYVPPSGHMAGIYARVDSQRGVYKAPANEPVLGAVGLKYSISKAQQDGLNPQGVNVIRPLNGNIYVWGARTIGGDANGEYKYISTRRYFNFLRESIDEGTQFAVFEPNSSALWQRIVRNVGDFLLGQWRDGALFGDTPKQAFFVRCDASTNPADVRERGQVVTEIGVAIVKPAEFVIFRIQQQTGS